MRPTPGDPSFGGDVWTAIPDPGFLGTPNAVEVWWKDVVGASTLALNDAFGAAVAERLEAWPQLFPGLDGPGVRLRGIHAQ